MKYEIYDQETGERIGKPVSTTRAAQRLVTLIHQKTGLWQEYRGIKNAGTVKFAINTGFDIECKDYKSGKGAPAASRS